MGIKDKIKKHGSKTREWRRIYVPEWEETIHYRAPNLVQEQAIANAGPLLWTARVLLEVSYTSMNIRLYSEDDWHLLTEDADPEVVKRVAMEMQKAWAMTDEEAKKPSETTDSSAPPSTSP